MSGYTVTTFEDVPDVLGDYPGEMRFLEGPLDCEQVAVTIRRMPAGSGGKGSYGHFHRTQEEVYVVTAGTLQFKLGDEVLEVGPAAAVRVAPEMPRSVWNEGPDDAWLVIVSTRLADRADEVGTVPDFWPE